MVPRTRTAWLPKRPVREGLNTAADRGLTGALVPGRSRDVPGMVRTGSVDHLDGGPGLSVVSVDVLEQHEPIAVLRR